MSGGHKYCPWDYHHHFFRCCCCNIIPSKKAIGCSSCWDHVPSGASMYVPVPQPRRSFQACRNAVTNIRSLFCCCFSRKRRENNPWAERREEAFVHLFPAHHRHVKKKPILSPWFRHMFLSERDFVALWAMESFFTSIHWLFFSFFSPKNMCK